MKKTIYLDYASTTPMCTPALEALFHCLGPQAAFGNPHSQHFYGQEAAAIVEESANLLASLIHAKPTEIIWTSGATEANNLAIAGAARFYASRGKHLITNAAEHKAVLDVFQHLKKEGFDITILPVNTQGLLEPETLKKALRPDTSLVSVMMVNNELGSIQPINQLGALIKKNGSLFHVDGAQALGKVPIDFEALQIDLLSLSAHKIYGPKGAGALVVRSKPRVHLTPLIYGGGQQHRLRAGTEAPGLIAAFAKAAEFACQALPEATQHIEKLRDQLWNALKMEVGVHANTDISISVPHILNLRFDAVGGETFLSNIANKLAISQAAACVSAETEPSHVLKAIGLTRIQADHSFRFSFGRMTTQGELEEAIRITRKANR